MRKLLMALSLKLALRVYLHHRRKIIQPHTKDLAGIDVLSNQTRFHSHRRILYEF
jgi:hypothetical protein